MSFCFLAALDESEGRRTEATQHWQYCQEKAYPASIEQYEDVMRLGGVGVNMHLNTQHILQSGFKPDSHGSH